MSIVNHTSEVDALKERLDEAITVAAYLARALGDLNWCHPAWVGDDPNRTVTQANDALHRWETYAREYGIRVRTVPARQTRQESR